MTTLTKEYGVIKTWIGEHAYTATAIAFVAGLLVGHFV